jgi:hypothetical protein
MKVGPNWNLTLDRAPRMLADPEGSHESCRVGAEKKVVSTPANPDSSIAVTLPRPCALATIFFRFCPQPSATRNVQTGRCAEGRDT